MKVTVDELAVTKIEEITMFGFRYYFYTIAGYPKLLLRTTGVSLDDLEGREVYIELFKAPCQNLLRPRQLRGEMLVDAILIERIPPGVRGDAVPLSHAIERVMSPVVLSSRRRRNRKKSKGEYAGWTIEIDYDEEVLRCGPKDWEGIDVDASRQKYEAMLIAKLEEAFPGAEIVINYCSSAGEDPRRISSPNGEDTSEVLLTVEDIDDAVYDKGDWYVYQEASKES